MSITVTTVTQRRAEQIADGYGDHSRSRQLVEQSEADGLRFRVHGGFARFLDDLMARLGAPAPACLFSQGQAAGPDNPGDLPAQACAELAAFLDALDDQQILDAMVECAPGPAARVHDQAALGALREVTRVIAAAPTAGGLAVH
jgi:hypothetical protein